VTPIATDGWRARVRRAVAAHWAEPLHRQSYYLLASTGVAAATGLLFWILAARRTEPAVLGLAAGMIAAIGFLSYLTSFALPYAMLRYGGSTRPVHGLVNYSAAVSAVTSLLAAALFAAVAGATGTVLAPLLRDPSPALSSTHPARSSLSPRKAFSIPMPTGQRGRPMGGCRRR